MCRILGLHFDFYYMKKYNFLSDREPSQQQLKGLMKAVLNDVKTRAEAAEQKFQALKAQQVKEAFTKWQELQQQHEQR